MMKKLAADHEKAPTSPQERLGARSPRVGAPAPALRRHQWPWRWRALRGPAAQASSHVAQRVPELVFAAVRPGFVAACMVEAASAERGQRIGPGGLSGGDRRPGRPGPHRRSASGRALGSPLARTRRADERRAAVQGSHNAVPCELKQTNGTFYPGVNRPSRRRSARSGYHPARARLRLGPAIGYFE
jgi:hypothetical protein